MTSRRDFIAKTLLLTSGAVFSGLPNQSAFSVATQKPKKAICIGAGFAGLSAAYRLKQNGWDVVVLESRKRIGGRVFSHQITSNHTIELGAEWVGASHERVIALCEQFKLKLLNNQFDSHLLYKGKYSPKGQWGYSATWEQKLEKILKDFKQLSDADQRKLDQYDWWRFLVNNGCAGQDLDLRELLDSTDFGESIRHVSAYSALAEYSESSPKNEMDYKILGGNSRLAEKLVEQIGMSHILLDHTVQHIEQADKVKVTCMNGEVFEADKLVCSLPTFAMKQIQWSPALPEAKMDAINELQYARINKHALVFSDRFWKDEAFDLVTDACPHYFYHATKNQPGPEGVLIGYTIGEKAAVFANRTQEANATDVNNTLKPLFGDILSKLQAQSNYYWGGDPYSQGAYALYGVNQWFRIRPVLAMPFLHTHFAGEHIADWQGFMEGAIVTGEDAADQIIS